MHVIEIVIISAVTLAAIYKIYKSAKGQYKDCDCSMCNKSCKMRKHFPGLREVFLPLNKAYIFR